MRKDVLIGACLFAVILVGGCGGGWMRAQTEAEIKAMFATLEANGGKVSHGPITTSLWSRSVAVDSISITPSADAPMGVSIGRISAEGISPSGRGSARRVVVQDLWVGNVSVKALPPLIKVPRIELTDFEFTPPPAAMATSEPVLSAVTGFAGVKARTIDAPMIATSFAMAGPPSRPGATVRIDHTYTDVRLEGISDGRIARAKIGSGSISGGAGALIVSGTIDGIDMTELDILPVFRIGLERRKTDGKMLKLQGQMSMGTSAFKTSEGGDISIGRATSAGMWIDPSKISYDQVLAFMKQAEAMQTSAATPQQQAAFGSSLAELYEGLRLDSAVIDDVKIKGRGLPDTVSLGRFALLGLDGGKLSEFRLEGLASKVPGKRGLEPLNIGLFSLEKLDLSGLLRFSMAALSTPRTNTEDILATVLPLLQGVELSGVAFSDPQTGQPVRLDTSNITWGAFNNGIPTHMKLAVRGRAPLSPSDLKTAVLVQNGVTALDVDLEMAARYDHKSQNLVLDPFVLVGAPLGQVTAKLALTNVPPAIFTSNAQQAQAAATSVELGELELNITDAGIIALARKIAGPSFATIVVAAARLQASQGTATAAEDAAFKSLEQFLSEPGQTLTLRLKPKTAARLSEIAPLVALGGPAALFAHIDVTTDVRR